MRGRGRIAWGWRLGLATALVAAFLGAVVAGDHTVAGDRVVASDHAAAGSTDRVLVAIERPSAATIRAVAARRDLDVRWVERGLVLLETAPGVELPPDWASRPVAVRAADRSLGILRGAELSRWRKPSGADAEIARFLESVRVAKLEPESGELWVLLAAPGAWPDELGGCHSGLVLPQHGCDPRSLIDAGPPAALRAWMAPPGRPFSAGERRVLAQVSAESLRANVTRLALDPLGRPADRFVFHGELDSLYAERVRATMERAVAGIPSATVELRPFPMRPNATDTVAAHNVVARIPGTVPGTGTWVVCGHIDATGSRDSAWRQLVQGGQKAVETPGAEDNATGVACVLELLRCVADGVRSGTVAFAFDVEFIAFSGEEVPIPPSPESGLVGSAAYVNHAVRAGVPLLGAYNFDMVGYDSIPGNLQIVHNTASQWLADFVRDAATPLVPPTPLHLTLDPDEGRASDHNSFWEVNAPALLAADASVARLRQYQSYHKPIDQISRVDMNKLYEVARVMLAALLRFDTRAQSEPVLLFAAGDLELLRTINGVDYEYLPSFHRLYPGTPLGAGVVVHSIGYPFYGPVHVELETRGAGGSDAFLDSVATEDLPAGDRLQLVAGVPIRSSDLGWRRVVATVTYADTGGAPVVQTQVDSFFVDANQQSELAVSIHPNPVQGSLANALLAFELDLPGDLVVEVYDLEGQRVASSTRNVVPRVTRTLFSLPLVPAGGATATGGGELAPGAYVVHVVWRGSNGETRSTTTPLAVVR